MALSSGSTTLRAGQPGVAGTHAWTSYDQGAAGGNVHTEVAAGRRGAGRGGRWRAFSDRGATLHAGQPGVARAPAWTSYDQCHNRRRPRALSYSSLSLSEQTLDELEAMLAGAGHLTYEEHSITTLPLSDALLLRLVTTVQLAKLQRKRAETRHKDVARRDANTTQEAPVSSSAI